MCKREFIARRIAKEFNDGDFINLGIGMPTMVANYIPEGVSITLHSENGLLGLGPEADESNLDPHIIDAGGNYVTVLKGACFFDSTTSFSIIRGGHLNATVLGALEVDQEGNLASWVIPGKKVTGMGGAMDLACGAKKVIIAMEHLNKKGQSKIVKKCTLPLTAVNVVDLIVTEMAVIDVIPDKGLLLKEIAPGSTVEDVIKATDADLIVSEQLKEIDVS